MKYETIKQKIIAYIDSAYQWHEEGEGTLDEDTGKQMVDLEAEILSSFGLPFTAQQYSDIMQAEGFSNQDKEIRANTLIELLKNEAEKYLLAPIEKDTEILSNARRKLKDAVEVLPLIGITATAYNCFLFYDVFFRGIYNEEEILFVLKQSEAANELPETRIPYVYADLIAGDKFEKLHKMKFPFLNEYKAFLKYKETKHNWDKYAGNDNLGDYFSLPHVFKLKHFIVEHIYLKNEETCCLTILITFGKTTLVELTLWCAASMMRLIMLHAKYYSLAIPPLYVSTPKFLNEGIVNIQIEEAIGKNVEIEGLKIEIERLNDVDDEIHNPFAYVITDIQPKDDLPTIDLTYNETDNLPF